MWRLNIHCLKFLLWWKESLNKDCQQFHPHYIIINKTNNHLSPQTIQNKQPPLTSNHSTQTTTSHLKPFNTNNHLSPETIQHKQPPLTWNHSTQTTTSHLNPFNTNNHLSPANIQHVTENIKFVEITTLFHTFCKTFLFFTVQQVSWIIKSDILMSHVKIFF
jgi:hypothetical protein